MKTVLLSMGLTTMALSQNTDIFSGFGGSFNTFPFFPERPVVQPLQPIPPIQTLPLPIELPAERQQCCGHNKIFVNGCGKVSIRPDIARLSIRVE